MKALDTNFLSPEVFKTRITEESCHKVGPYGRQGLENLETNTKLRSPGSKTKENQRKPEENKRKPTKTKDRQGPSDPTV